jgi:flagellar hook-associated protein 3 FlgL
MGFSLDAIYHNASWAIYSHSTKLMELQEKSVTGQEINRTSDDSVKANRILDLRADSRGLEVNISTLDDAISILELGGSVAQSISAQLSDAMESLTSVLSGIMNAEGDSNIRSQLADDLDSILEQVVSLANTQRLGQRLFSGSATDTDPYAVTRNDDGDITRVEYQGSHQERMIEVANGVEMSATLVGDNIFVNDERQNPEFVGTTGAAAGSGTSSIRGDIWFTAKPAGGGTYDVSIDDGNNWVNVDPATDTNLAIVHPDTGETLYLDASGINVTSETTERVRVRGTYDMFNVLIAARDMLRSQSRMNTEDWHNIMEDMVQDLRGVEQKISQLFPVIGGKINTLSTLRDNLDDIKFGTDSEVSRLQDADIAQVATDLARYEVLYQLSLSVANKMFSMSLLDFM